MRITDSQKKFLDSLKCHRLSCFPEHKDLILSFENNRNRNLVDGLKSVAWGEDADGSTAYYLVKNGDDCPMFFFSLKCGALYNHLDESQIIERKKSYLLAKRLLTNPKNKEEKEIAAILLERLRAGNSVQDDEIKRFLEAKVGKKQELLDVLLDDKNRDPNRHIIRVENTHSGIELVHFCTNEAARDIWNSYLMPQSLGKVIFWNFIVPKIEEVRQIVGCKYLFLFAADSTEDGTLINYYNIELKLSRPDNIGTSKPIYDFNCVFMCNDINSLLYHRKCFFDNFNPDIKEDVV